MAVTCASLKAIDRLCASFRWLRAAALSPSVVAALLLYFIPWIIAIVRNHPRRSVIALLTLLFDRTMIGWITALLWSAVPIDTGSGMADASTRISVDNPGGVRLSIGIWPGQLDPGKGLVLHGAAIDRVIRIQAAAAQ